MASAPTTWGHWTLNSATGTLDCTIPNTTQVYDVPVYDLTDSAEILDWIFQVEEKSWATSEITGEFVEALRTILGRGVASMGKNNPIKPKAILAAKYGIIIP